MAQIIVQFDSEQEARRVMARLEEANVGDVRMRVLEGSESEGVGHPTGENTAPMITADMGSVEVRPTETPEKPEAEHKAGGPDQGVSASIPTTGTGQAGIQVMIEIDDRFEDEVRRIMKKP